MPCLFTIVRWSLHLNCKKRLEDAMPFYNRALELAPELFEAFPEILAKMNK